MKHTLEGMNSRPGDTEEHIGDLEKQNSGYHTVRTAKIKTNFKK